MHRDGGPLARRGSPGPVGCPVRPLRLEVTPDLGEQTARIAIDSDDPDEPHLEVDLIIIGVGAALVLCPTSGLDATPSRCNENLMVRLAGVGLALEYDENVLTATSVAPGGFITGNAGWSIVDNLGTAGRVVVVGFTSTPVGGSINDVLVNVTFVVNGAVLSRSARVVVR